VLLKGRTAIVYGASGAVGGAVARAFAREGARVVLAARRREPLEEAAADIRSCDGLAEVMPVDATDPQAVEQHLQAVTERWEPVSLMFNAVSWADVQGEVLAAMPFDQFFAPIQTGLTTWFYTGTALARHMAQHGGGTILGITANAGARAAVWGGRLWRGVRGGGALSPAAGRRERPAPGAGVLGAIAGIA
jgi:7-alpha-hydroxysteroid dehydrogenase